MPNLAAGDVVTVEWQDRCFDQIGVVTFGLRVSAVGGASVTLTELADFIYSSAIGSWQAKSSSSVIMDIVRCYRLDPATARAIDKGFHLDAVTVGSVTQNVMAKQAAAVVKKLTARVGRRYRGRLFVPFLPVGSVDGQGNMSNAYKTLVGAFATDYTSGGVATGAGGTATYLPVLLHRDGPVGARLSSTDLVGISTLGLIGNQRRRGNFGAKN